MKMLTVYTGLAVLVTLMIAGCGSDAKSDPSNAPDRTPAAQKPALSSQEKAPSYDSPAKLIAAYDAAYRARDYELATMS